MKIDEKRKVIEVLLCAAAPADSHTGDRATTLSTALDHLGVHAGSERMRLFHCAFTARRSAASDLGIGSLHAGSESPYAETCTEAAYRLIESSATLRKEWFGQ